MSAIAKILLFLLLGRLAHAQETDVADSNGVGLSKIPALQTWERLVALPGTLVYLPLHLLSDGAERLLGLQEERRYYQRAYDLLTSDNDKRGIRPAFESRSGVGASFFDRRETASCCEILAAVMAGTRGRHGAILEAARNPAAGPRWRLDADYRFMPDEAFWGIGPEAKKSAKTSYAHLFFGSGLWVDWTLSQSWDLSAGVGAEFNAIGKGRDADSPSTTAAFDGLALPGLEEDALLGNAKLVLTYDTRDRLGNPSRGWKGVLGGNLQRQLDGSRFGFARMSFEVVRYIPLFYQRVLVLRVGTDLVRPLAGRSVPFYRLSQIGDEATTIRGFDRGRFRERQAAFGAAEYRYPVWRTLDALFFFNAGQVGRDVFGELGTAKAVSGYGAGLRAWSETGRVTRLLLSRSDDGMLVQIFFQAGF